MSGPRKILEAVGARGGTAAGIIDHLTAGGAKSAREISREFAITRQGARAQLVRLHEAGVVELDHRRNRVLGDYGAHRYCVDPEALRYAARWLDALADRAERVNEDARMVRTPIGL
jgi:DNA-binding IclR family transcriptional regulator